MITFKTFYKLEQILWRFTTRFGYLFYISFYWVLIFVPAVIILMYGINILQSKTTILDMTFDIPVLAFCGIIFGHCSWVIGQKKI